MRKLERRWQALDRTAQRTLVALAALSAAAVGLRLWLMVGYGPAFLGFPDSAQYAAAAAHDIFRDTQHPAGYPFFLRLVHHLDGRLSFVIAVQHVLGVASGLLLYGAVRRTGAPPWLGLVPAAVVFFGATGLWLEHSLLADPVLMFLQALGVYLGVRALYGRSLGWPLLAAIAIGLSFWVKTVAISSVVLLPLLLLCATPGGLRRRLPGALVAAATGLAMVLAYVGVQDYFTGYFGYERQSAWNLYARVATFVDCTDFTPPRGTRFLCPSEPVSRRKGGNYFQYAYTSPAVERFGPPFLAEGRANAVLKKFSVAAIEHEPLDYTGAIAKGLGTYVFPREGEGYTPRLLREALLERSETHVDQSVFALLYRDDLGYTGPMGALAAYESFTRVQGTLLIVLLVAGIAGPFWLVGRMRWAAAFCTLTALLSIAVAIAGNSYDARYAYPTFGPLAAGAALGAWGAGSRLVKARQRWRSAAGRDRAARARAA